MDTLPGSARTQDVMRDASDVIRAVAPAVVGPVSLVVRVETKSEIAAALVAILRTSTQFADCGCNGIQEVVLRVLVGAEAEARFELMVALCETVGRRAHGQPHCSLPDLVANGDLANAACFLGVDGAVGFLATFLKTRFRAIHAVHNDFGVDQPIRGVVLVALALLNLAPDGAACEHRVVFVHDGAWSAMNAYRSDAIGTRMAPAVVPVHMPTYLDDLQTWCAFEGRAWDSSSPCAEAYARLCLVPAAARQALLRADLDGCQFTPAVYSQRFVVSQEAMDAHIRDCNVEEL